jgi:hypothetical protein
VTPRPSGLFAAALLVLAACADRAPISDSAALTGCVLDFVAPSSVALGTRPAAVVVADFDGDGHPDLAATNGAGSVTVALARGGGFAAPRALPAGDARGLVAGDFDGDGKVDLVVTNAGGVGVLLGRGDGSFGAPRSFDVGAVPAAIVAGDFDHDGRLDVAVAVGGRVGVLLGGGDGSFQAARWSTSLPLGERLVAGDIDGDGKLDLLVTTKSERARTLYAPLFGNGDGTFRSEPARDFAQSADDDAVVVQGIAAGDLDGDGKLDLVLASTLHAPDYPGFVGVLLGKGDGTFRRGGGAGGFNRFYPSAVALADLDGDGKLDVIANITRDHVVLTALGKGDGSLGPVAYHQAAGPLLAAADLDGDGKADVLAARDDGVAVSWGNGDGTLRAPRAFQIGCGGGFTGRVTAGDFNGDGFADVAVTCDSTSVSNVHVFLGDGRGDLREASTNGIWNGSARDDIAAVDLDGDGILDLVDLVDPVVMLGNGDGTFRRIDPSLLAYGNGQVLGDFDGDGKIDVVLYPRRGPGLTFVPGKGDGTFASDRKATIAIPGTSTGAVTAADLNGDGKLDLAVSTETSLLVLFNRGNGTFAPGRPLDGVTSVKAVAAADLDGDGGIDLVAAHAGDDASTVLLNMGGGAFRPAGTVPSSGRLRVADLDGDGVPDLLVQGDVLAVYRGSGDGTFDAGRVYPAGGNDFAIADLDGDGRPDVVVAVGGRRVDRPNLPSMSPFVSVMRSASRGGARPH